MSEHLDASTVVAFSAGALTAQQRSRVFEHLADCESCREWVATYSKVRRRRVAPPVWALAAAAAIACAVFSWWLTASHSSAVATPVRLVQLPVTMTIMDLTPTHNAPAAWKQIRLAPELSPGGIKPTRRQVSLQTTVGEKWISIDGAWGSVVP